MAMDLTLVPSGTVVEENGEGPAFDVSGSSSRTFLCTLQVFDQIEQESIDLNIWGSGDGQDWGPRPILKLPQQFYRGETSLLLELTHHPEVKFIRARWELNRWGRVAPAPRFVIGAQASEVPAMAAYR